jgi:excisionase family DNA binding protein
MKDILLIGGPATLKGVDRIDDDLLSILSVKGLYDRKAVIVWPSSGFLNFPVDPDSLRPYVDMEKATLSVIRQRGMVSSDVSNSEIDAGLIAEVQADPEAIRHGVIGQALTEALLRLAKLNLAVSGGQNVVAVVGDDAPVYAMCWTRFVESWSDSDSKESRNYKSDDAGYGVLNSVKSWPRIFKVRRLRSWEGGDLIPKDSFQLYGYAVTIRIDSLFDVLESHGAAVELSYPVSDRFGSARAVKVSSDGGYLLVIPEPDKLKNFLIGLKAGKAAKAKAVEPKSKVATAEEYVTVKEAAEILKCSEKTIRNYYNASKLEHKKIGQRKVLILKSSVDTLLGE